MAQAHLFASNGDDSMNELIALGIGVVIGALAVIHVCRRYHKRDGKYGDLVRQLLG